MIERAAGIPLRIKSVMLPTMKDVLDEEINIFKKMKFLVLTHISLLSPS